VVFYSKNALTPLPAWSEQAIEQRLRDMDGLSQLMTKQMEGTTFNQQMLKDTIQMQRDQCMYRPAKLCWMPGILTTATVATLTMQTQNLSKENDNFREQLSDLRDENSGLAILQTELQRNHEIEVDDLERKHRHELENMRDGHRREVDRLRRDTSDEEDTARRQHRQEIDELNRRHRQELEDLEKRYKDELNEEKVCNYLINFNYISIPTTNADLKTGASITRSQ
jgi:hypothetical protein